MVIPVVVEYATHQTLAIQWQHETIARDLAGLTNTLNRSTIR